MGVRMKKLVIVLIVVGLLAGGMYLTKYVKQRQRTEQILERVEAVMTTVKDGEMDRGTLAFVGRANANIGMERSLDRINTWVSESPVEPGMSWEIVSSELDFEAQLARVEMLIDGKPETLIVPFEETMYFLEP